MELIYPYYNLGKTNLAEFNMSIIQTFLNFLKIKVKFVKLSNLNLHTKKNQLLIDITNINNANTFVSGTGAKNYIEGHEEYYKKSNVNLAYQNFIHPKYNQMQKSFVEGMSIVDLLFNYGINSTKILENIAKPDYIYV